MAPKSRLRAELEAVNAELDGVLTRIEGVNAARIEPVIYAPTAPQGPGVLGSSSGGVVSVDASGGDGRLQRRTAAGSLLPSGGSSAPGLGVGQGSPTIGALAGAGGSGKASGASSSGGGSTGLLSPEESWGVLVEGPGGRWIMVPGFPPGDPAAVGRPTTTKYEVGGVPGRPPESVEIQGFDCAAVLTWPPLARTVYWRVPEAQDIGQRMSAKGSGGSSTGFGKKFLYVDPLGNYNQAAAGTGQYAPGAPGYLGGSTLFATGGKSSAMSTGEQAIVGALGAVTSELKEIRRESKSAGLTLRSGGLA